MSDKGDKTVVVVVQRTLLHPVLKKIVRLSKKYHAHDDFTLKTISDYTRTRQTADGLSEEEKKSQEALLERLREAGI